jgi:hypothetical protein
MKRHLVGGVLVLSLLIAGCATPKPLFPPGEDPDQVVEAIARRGEDKGPGQTVSEGPALLSDCLVITTKVGLSCMLISLLLGYCLCAAKSGAGSSNAPGDCFGAALQAIWSKD